MKNTLALLVLISFLSFPSCSKKNKLPTEEKQNQSFTASFEKDWSKIEQLEKEGMAKSIVSLCDTLLLKARKTESYNDVFRALAVRSKYIERVEEESSTQIISDFENEMAKANFPLNAILASATAQLYQHYLNQNRWKLNQRTVYASSWESEISSWSTEQLEEKIEALYWTSLENEAALANTPFSFIGPIVYPFYTKESASNLDLPLQPNSLLDFLSFRALNHYQQTEVLPLLRGIELENIRPFSLSTELLPPPQIIPNPSDKNQKIESIYQAIFRNIGKDHTDFRVDIELHRLQHSYTQTSVADKDSLYENALIRLANDLEGKPSLSKVHFALAQHFQQLGNQYQEEFPIDTQEYKLLLKKAVEHCNLISAEDSSMAAKKCRWIKEQIQRPHFSLQMEKVVLPQKKTLFKVDYKNTPDLYFSVFPIPENLKLNRYGRLPNHEEVLKELVNTKPVLNWQVTLNPSDDYQNHQTELYFDELPFGAYILLASRTSQISVQNYELAYVSFQVSQLSLISRDDYQDNKLELFTLDRNSGKALEKVKIESYTYQRSASEEKIGEYYSDKNGYLKIDKCQNCKSVFFKLSLGKDVLEPKEWYGLYSNHFPEERTSLETKFFTDRAIYRPGQTLYFKGISLNVKGDKTSIAANTTRAITLYDPNGKVVQTLNKTSNEWGSVEGQFLLPKNTLTGMFRISDANGNQYVKVEEYKRPTFKINFDSLSNAPKFGEKMVLNGQVISYAGAAISSAKLSYQIVRKVPYPIWPFYHYYMPQMKDEVVSTGKIEANQNGEFSLSYTPENTLSAQLSKTSIFTYEVQMDATSLAGETQAEQFNFKLCNQALFITSNLSTTCQLEDLKELKLLGKDVNNKTLEGKVKFQLFKLKSPSTYSIPKLWRTPTEQVLKEKNYHNLFPQHQFQKEKEITELPIEYEVTSAQISLNEKANLINTLKAGFYLIKAETKDQYGTIVKFEQGIELLIPEGKTLAIPTFFKAMALKEKIEPGEEAQVLVQTSLKNLPILLEVEVDNRIVSSEHILLNEEQRLLRFPIKEMHRGNFTIHLTGVHSNQMIQKSIAIKVPHSNKKLNLQLSSFRSPIEPGSKENWKLKIVDKDLKPVNAEVLASMYDQSLDVFEKQDWLLDLYAERYPRLMWRRAQDFTSSSSSFVSNRRNQFSWPPQGQIPDLNWFGLSLNSYNRRMPYEAQLYTLSDNEAMLDDMDMGEVSRKSKMAEKAEVNSTQAKKSPSTSPPLRKNFDETLFFYPLLTSNEKGEIDLPFTMSDVLTTWKFRAIAHSKSLQIGSIEQSLICQKQLMVKAQMPRFFRQNDEITLQCSIDNLSDSLMEGQVSLTFFDAFTKRELDLGLRTTSSLNFSIPGKSSDVKSWKVKIPYQVNGISYRLVAKTMQFEDGEENSIPVLSSRQRIIESRPLSARGGESKSLVFDRYISSFDNNSIHNESYVLEYSANPIWYAIAAFPSLSDDNAEASDRLFNSYFSKKLAEKMMQEQPSIKTLFKQMLDPSTIRSGSALEQNQELKQVLLAETPWLNEAKNETEQMQRLILYLNENNLKQEQALALKNLSEKQLSDGSWPWYKGMRGNTFVTLSIIKGFGLLNQLGINTGFNANIEKGFEYLDQAFSEDYQRLLKHKESLENYVPSAEQILYLYSRSLFPEIAMPKNREAFDFFLKQSASTWLKQNLLLKAQVALILHRFKPNETLPATIIKSIEDHAILSDELGMYWKENTGGYYWSQSKIATQVEIMAAFAELDKNSAKIDEQKRWLLKHKQGNSWNGNAAAALACHALITYGSSWINQSNEVMIQVGDEVLKPESSKNSNPFSYLKKTWNTNELKADLGKVELINSGEAPSWGAVYWVYEQDMDQISASSDNALSIQKEIYKVQQTPEGEVASVLGNEPAKVGDKLIVRLRLEVDRDLQFLHVQDLRASCLEPFYSSSSYRYQEGLSYYQSIKDSKSDYFIEYISKGVYYFEYPVRVAQAGNFSNGVANIQCLYAPEFGAHSKGGKLEIIAE